MEGDPKANKRKSNKSKGDDPGESKDKKSKEQRERERQERKQREEREAAEREERQRLERIQREEMERNEALKREQAEEEREERELAEELDRLKKMAVTFQERVQLRTANLNAAESRLTEAQIKQLDSSLKKNTAFVKKLKSGPFDDTTLPALITDVVKLNLSRYIDEVAASLADATAKMKGPEINTITLICSHLHQRYAEFSPALMANLTKVFSPVLDCITNKKWDKNAISPKDNETQTRRKVTLRLIAELYVTGVHSDFTLIRNLLLALCKDNNAKGEGVREGIIRHGNLTLITAVTRALSDSLFGLAPLSRVRLNTARTATIEAALKECLEQRTGRLMDEEDQVKLRRIVVDYYTACCDSLLSEHQVLKEMEKEFHRVLATRGEGDESAMAGAHDRFRKLQTNVHALGNVLQLPLPELQEEDNTTRMLPSDAVLVGDGAQSLVSDVDFGPFDDGEERAFYEDIPDLKAHVPAVLLGLDANNSNSSNNSNSNNNNNNNNANSSTDTKGEESEDESTVQRDSEQKITKQDDDNATGLANINSSNNNGGSGGNDKGESAIESLGDMSDITNDADTKKDTKSPISRLIARLPDCVNRDLTDAWVIDFCYLNSKGNRNKLIKALFSSPRTQLELLPYYARIVATLTPFFKEIRDKVVYLLEEELTFLQQRKKDQVMLETKVKNIRFLAELVKFKLCPHNTIFTLLRSCLDEMTPHNIEVACNLLEVCGRFLYRSPATAVRMANMLDIFIKLKQVKINDPRLEMMASSAILACRPVKRVNKDKNKPPIHRFIKHLLYHKLCAAELDFVARKFRKFPWSDTTLRCDEYVRRKVIKVQKFRFDNIPALAQLLALLARYRRELIVSVVDCLLEAVRADLEENDFRQQQTRIATVALIAELYNNRLVNSDIIFNILTQMLEFGDSGESSGAGSSSDQQELGDSFRVRLIATVLFHCGHAFSSEATKRRLDVFLIKFQVFCLRKRLGMDTLFVLDDLFEQLRPAMTRYRSVEDAKDALSKLDALPVANTKINDVCEGSDEEREGKGEEEGDEDDRDKKRSRSIVVPSEQLNADDANENSLREDEDEEELGDDSDNSDDNNNMGDANQHGDEIQQEQDEEDYRRPQAHEDLLFDAELQSMMQESLKEARSSSHGHTNTPLPVVGPMTNSSATGLVPPDSDSLVFQMLVRKGGKTHTLATKAIVVPAESELGLFSMRQTERDRSNQEELKRAVLDYEQREHHTLVDDAGAEPFLRPRGRGRGQRGGRQRVLASTGTSSSSPSNPPPAQPRIIGPRGGRVLNLSGES